MKVISTLFRTELFCLSWSSEMEEPWRMSTRAGKLKNTHLPSFCPPPGGVILTTIHKYISWHQFLTFITLNRTSWPRLSWPLKNSCSGYVRAMSLRMSFSHGDDIFSSSEYWFFTGMSVALPSSCHTMARKWWGMPFLMSSWGAERGGAAEGDQYLVLVQWSPDISQRAGSSGSDERSQL